MITTLYRKCKSALAAFRPNPVVRQEQTVVHTLMQITGVVDYQYNYNEEDRRHLFAFRYCLHDFLLIANQGDSTLRIMLYSNEFFALSQMQMLSFFCQSCQQIDPLIFPTCEINKEEGKIDLVINAFVNISQCNDSTAMQLQKKLLFCIQKLNFCLELAARDALNSTSSSETGETEELDEAFPIETQHYEQRLRRHMGSHENIHNALSLKDKNSLKTVLQFLRKGQRLDLQELRFWYADGNSSHFVEADEIAEISHTDLFAFMSNMAQEQDESNYHFTQTCLTILLRFQADRGQHHALLHCVPVEENNELLGMEIHYSMYADQSPATPHNNVSERIEHLQLEQSHACLRLNLLKDKEKQQQAFRYMMAETSAALKSQELLNAEQRFVLQEKKEMPIVYFLFRGRRLFYSKHYYEALAYLEPAYHHLSQHIDKVEAKQFLELRYYLGLCYMELGFYKQAYFYLDLAGQDNAQHAKARIVCLVRSLDVMAWQEISLMQRVVRSKKEYLEEQKASGDLSHKAYKKALSECLDMDEFLLLQQVIFFFLQRDFEQARQHALKLYEVPTLHDEASDMLRMIDMMEWVPHFTEECYSIAADSQLTLSEKYAQVKKIVQPIIAAQSAKDATDDATTQS